MFLKEIYSKELIKKSHQQQTDNKLFIPMETPYLVPLHLFLLL